MSAETVAALVAEGRAHFLANRLPEARERFERAREADPGEVRALHHLGLIAAATGDLDGADAYAEQAHAAMPQAVETGFELGAVRVRQGRPAEGLPLLGAVLRHLPHQLGVAGWAAEALLLLGREAELAPLFRQTWAAAAADDAKLAAAIAAVPELLGEPALVTAIYAAAAAVAPPPAAEALARRAAGGVPEAVDGPWGALAALPAPKRTSACLIVRDEEAVLATALKSIAGLAHETIVVDMGSRDGTVAIAEAHGARVLHREWTDDFAAARNVGLDEARGDWILVVDADNELDPRSRIPLRRLLQRPTEEGGRPVCYLPLIAERSVPKRSHQLLIFPNDQDLRFQGAIHEQVTDRREPARLLYMRPAPELVLHHDGYSPEAIARHDKRNRNRRILDRQLAERPDDPFVRFNLAQHHVSRNEPGPALEHALAALELGGEPAPGATPPYMLAAHVIAATLLLGEQGFQRAGLICAAGLRGFPDSPDLLSMLALCHLAFNRPEEAVGPLEAALRQRGQVGNWASDPKYAGWFSASLLAIAHWMLGDADGCDRHLLAALDAAPSPVALVGHMRMMAAKLLDTPRAGDALLARIGVQIVAESGAPPPAAAKPLSAQTQRPPAPRPTEAPERSAPPPPAPAPAPAAPRRKAAKGLPVRWVGDQLTGHSFAIANREICARLLASGRVDLELMTRPGSNEDDFTGTPFAVLKRHMRPLGRSPAVEVMHAYPPLPPQTDRPFAAFVHWEYGGFPKPWVEQLTRDADEIWVASRYVRDNAVASGLPAERVHVVPLGVDVRRYTPEGPKRALPTEAGFKFLFVGGFMSRKGLDVLLPAYLAAFKASDDVCLVIKEVGGYDNLRGPIAEQLATIMAMPNRPAIAVIAEDLPPDERPPLYRACDALVHPYRGEGFGLPVVEAMASGLPVIVTAGGACAELCDDASAYLIPSELRRVNVNDAPPPASGYWWLEPDVQALSKLLRQAYDDRAATTEKGRQARIQVEARFRWERTAAIIADRLDGLAGRTPHRRRHADGPNPRVAVVTAYRDEPVEALRRAHESVRAQSVRATHFLVGEGPIRPEVARWGAQHLHLPADHGDAGNTARTLGAISALNQGFEAVMFLDAEGWLDPDHLQGLIEAQRASGALVVAAGADDGAPPAANGLLVMQAAAVLLPVWGMMPPAAAVARERVFADAAARHGVAIAHAGLTSAHGGARDHAARAAALPAGLDDALAARLRLPAARAGAPA